MVCAFVIRELAEIQIATNVAQLDIIV